MNPVNGVACGTLYNLANQESRSHLRNRPEEQNNLEAPKSTVNHRTTRACLRWVAIRRHEYELLDERRRCRPQSQWRGLQPPQRP
ncbi:hypothetical protein V495_06632 [Pseudogymnoascus sp. VKM F-4514 (FW-929)]|nr:hypothetical protein V490_07718 [Pseudogymnoascus sp. VKM F-3557]KFY38320.1 hypothetical protein V495_06632 [Pseudogymnoascus sp. VKM F-4514 (FW-929)]KFY56167.1 hypothetical protein V497_06463 [Pseudogymnoascus sp. VKM F-4516 (FW-969)]